MWIFVLALLARLAWVATLKNSYYWADEESFAVIARHLVNGEGYIANSSRANWVQPGYMSLVFYFFGENLFVGRVGLCILGALTCVLIAGIGGRLFSRPVGTLAGLALALYPSHIYLSGVFYAEGMMIFWGALAVYFALRVMTSPHCITWAALTGMALAMGSLTRTLVVPWFACISFAWLLHFNWNWRVWWRPCVVFLVMGAACILPWTYRNYRVYHAFIPVQSGFGASLWLANNPLADGSHADWDLYPLTPAWEQRVAQFPPAEREAIRTEHGHLQEEILRKKAKLKDSVAGDLVLGPAGLRCLLKHPGHSAKCAWRRFCSIYSPFSWTVAQNEHTRSHFKLIAACSTYPVLFLAAAGMLRFLVRFRDLSLLYLMIASVTLLLCIMTGTQTRYRLTLDPYFMLFAAATAMQIKKWLTATHETP